MSAFEAAFQVQWSDLDSNNHMRNTGFLDYAAQTRMLFFAAHGFAPDAFSTHGVGPVAIEDTLRYRREMRMLEPFRVIFSCAGMNARGSRFIFENQILKDQDTLCATVRTRGIWMDLNTRRPVAPPDVLMRAMETLPRTADFEEMR